MVQADTPWFESSRLGAGPSLMRQPSTASHPWAGNTPRGVCFPNDSTVLPAIGPREPTVGRGGRRRILAALP